MRANKIIKAVAKAKLNSKNGEDDLLILPNFLSILNIREDAARSTAASFEVISDYHFPTTIFTSTRRH